MKFELMHWLGIAVGVILAGASSYLFRENSDLMKFLLVVSILAMVVPFFISFILSENRQREKEEKFLKLQ